MTMDTQGDTLVTEPPEPPQEPPRRRGSSDFLSVFGHREGASFLERYAGVALLLALIGVFGLLEPDLFLTRQNFIGILSNEAVAGIITLGLLAPLAGHCFDVSIGGMMTLAVVAVTWLFQATEGAMPIPLAILIVLGVAVVVGLINAAVVVKGGVDPLIGTIGTGTVYAGVSQILGNGATITFDIPVSFTRIGRGDVLGVPSTVVIFAVLALLLHYVLAHTPWGRSLYATGAGEDAARLSGVRTARVRTVAYVISACGAALAGIVLASRLGSGPPGAGESYLLPAFSTAFLGATMIRPGRFNVGGIIIAMLIIAVGINGLQIVGIPFWVVDIFQGSALVAAVLLSRMQAQRR